MSPEVSPSILSWVDELRRISQAVYKKPKKESNLKKRLFYVLSFTEEKEPAIKIVRGASVETAEIWDSVDRALLKPPAFVLEEDLAILPRLWASRHYDYQSGFDVFLLNHKSKLSLLEKIAQTNRFYSNDFTLLSWGEPREGQVFWRVNSDGLQVPQTRAAPLASFMINSLNPPCYVDLTSAEIGQVNVAGNAAVIASLMNLPPLTEEEAELVSGALAEIAPELPVPKENARAQLRVISVDPQPILRFFTHAYYSYRQWKKHQWRGAGELDVAQPRFSYEGIEIFPDDPHVFFELENGETVRLERNERAERQAIHFLAKLGLDKLPSFVLSGKNQPSHVYALEEENAWDEFMKINIPRLQEAGFAVQFDAGFRHHVLTVDAWEADLQESENGWFDLNMGIIVGGERLALAPLLAALFKNDARWLDGFELAQINDDENISLVTADERRIRVKASRIKPLALTLMDLFDGFLGGDSLRLSRLDAPRLAHLADTSRWQFRGQDDILALAERLKSAQGIQNAPTPKGLQLSLRGYQQEGVSWLQFLREYRLSGILADDMGLGKTAQALAHLLLEKESGRMTKPALIVLPTSLIFNWKNEAQRFAPSLSVLSLHGADRKARFEEIADHDLILTTYPLLWRDAKILQQQEYYLLILDEAQTVKNARSQGAEAVRKIRATHRLCLTGTPLENHLGELWSQFDFLLPGFLGEHKQFTKYWRNPIEKEGDNTRRQLLAARIRPFILRRKKQDVAQELPEKTVIIRKIELTGAQRDLYETVRVAMDSVIREEVAAKGFARSQIIILDALLKLRQVCCDPRLVKFTAKDKIKERAKLDFLMTMLPEMVEEGRKILLFSQFTQMLALIEKELVEAKLPYVILTGDTNDRETPVKRFQAGEVPIFLISLKAGGVGLNLTAADTVIHYDPWWNPAVENQATDRAHRLGQDKAVFVYKLIVEGSIEEKILALQEKKAKLAEGILSADAKVELKFGQEDLAALFAPLPE